VAAFFSVFCIVPGYYFEYILWISLLIYPVKVSKRSKNHDSSKDNQHKSTQKFPLNGFMMKHIHAYQSTKKSPNSGKSEKRFFLDSPPLVLSFPFIDSSYNKGENIDECKISQQDIPENLHD